ncbi:glycosyltransferase [Companilactobacillus insicii]|uniref:glycosyltransferase n=1 Tax=Companilactobacillus insicii TaxID=1732567 RepID=UPI001FEB0B9B|nr:glycosyltransferase family 2 protein [Companilactobacillus insicii]
MIFSFFNDQYQKTNSNNTNKKEKFFYIILIPCLNEEKVIGNTLKQLLEMQMEKHIIVIDDASIDNTVSTVENISGPITIIKRKKPNAQIGKGSALNSAVPTIKSIIKQSSFDQAHSIIGVMDADGVLSFNSSVELDNAFADKSVAAAQLRVKMKSPKTILQTFQDIEFFVINHLTQLFRSYIDATALCGNGQFFRASSVFDKLGDKPWGNALLEDYELTLRMKLKSLKIKYIGNAYVDQEALTSLKKLVVQRARWSQGGFNCWKYLKQVMRSKTMSKLQKSDVLLFCIMPILNILSDITIIIYTVKFFIIDSGDLLNGLIDFFFLSILGLLFGVLFTELYIRELKKTEKNGVIINHTDFLNEHSNLVKRLRAILLVSYMYIVFFVSLMISIFRLSKNNNSWVKTKRI